MATDLKKTLGARVRASRLAQGLTQEQLAERIEKSVQTVSAIERGVYLAGVDTLLDLAKALETPLHILLAETQTASLRREEKEFEALLLIRSLSERDIDVAIAQLRALADRR